MKAGFIIAVCLLLASPAMAEGVEVLANLVKSTGHVRVLVLLDGPPASKVMVDFCGNGAAGEPCAPVVTGDDGVAAPPLLKPGLYEVVAALDEDIKGTLYLQVSGSDGTMTLPIDLTGSSHAALEMADKLPVREQLQDLDGYLRDESGAVIAGANVKIMRKGSEDHAIIRPLTSDAAGHFSTHLDNGIYIAFVSMQGFRTASVPFEIATQEKKEMTVKLQVGGC